MFKKAVLFSAALLALWQNTSLFAFGPLKDREQAEKRQTVQAAAVHTGRTDLPRELQQKLRSIATLITPATPPHDHDKQILVHARTLDEIFYCYLPTRCNFVGAPAAHDYRHSTHTLSTTADRLDAINNTALNPLPHWVTYKNLAQQRLDNPKGELNHATHMLLVMCAFFCDNDVQIGAVTPRAAANPNVEWLRLAQDMVPPNPSASAVYNVLLTALARELLRVFP